MVSLVIPPYEQPITQHPPGLDIVTLTAQMFTNNRLPYHELIYLTSLGIKQINIINAETTSDIKLPSYQMAGIQVYVQGYLDIIEPIKMDMRYMESTGYSAVGLIRNLVKPDTSRLIFVIESALRKDDVRMTLINFT